MSTILDAALAHVGDGVLTAHGYAYLGALCGKLEARADGWQDSPPASDRIGAVMDHAIDDVLSDCLPESMAPLAPVLRLALQAGTAALWRSLTAKQMWTAPVVVVVEVP